MRFEFTCLASDPLWLRRYLLAWHGLLTFGTIAFLGLQGTYAIVAQALFFAVLFPLILWPLGEAMRSGTAAGCG